MRRLTVGAIALAVVVVVLSQYAGADTVQYQIAASADDTHCSSGSNYVGNSTMNFPYNNDTERRPFFRWAVNIPDGATIQSAYLKVKAQATSTTNATIRLWLLDYDSCSSFSTNPYSWSMVAGTGVDWVLPNPWTADTWYTSPDIKTIVQSFIDRPGYSPGNYLGLRGQWQSGAYKWAYQYYLGTSNGAILEVTYSTNVAPTANAGNDQEVDDDDDTGAETVTLDGSGSSDSDGTLASYVWKEGATQIATGATAQVSLSTGTHTLTLTVTDDDGATDDDTVVVTVNAHINVPPVADAGSDQNLTDSDGSGYETAVLSGAGSSDSDGTIANYVWKEGATQIATGSTAQVSLAVGAHTITLTVTDDDGATDDDTMTVHVNAPPTAHAGSDQVVADADGNGSQTITLNGSASSDTDGTIAGYVWKEGATQVATGSTAQVSLATGTHTITLTVTDDDGATDNDDVIVTVKPLVTVQFQVAASVDDTHCSSASNYVGNSNMNFPYSSDNERRPFCRWALNLPYGATIQSAYLKIKSYSTSSSATTMKLWLLDYDNCAAFSTNPYSWSMVSGTDVSWVMPNPFTAGEWYTSPDIKTIVQSFIDRPGYVTGNYLGLRGQWVSGAYKMAYQRDSGATNGAILEVSYTGGNFPPTADAGSDQVAVDSDYNGWATATLNGGASSDVDGTITSYVWSEGGSQIATGSTAEVSMAPGTHLVTLTVTDNDGATDTDTVLVTVHSAYYVDFDAGSDANSGTSAGAAWKHCPGDPNATGVPASITLVGGCKIIFKGGVAYRGSITCNFSGSEGLPIIYDGNTAGTFGTGMAVLDGSESISGWTQCTSAAEAGGNPNYANIWYAYAPANTTANTSNLYQTNASTGDENMCWMAQSPNQGEPFFQDSISYFYTVPYSAVTTTSVTDSSVLTQADANFWNGAYVMVWVQPNMVDARPITGFNPATDTITFSAVGTPYTDRDEKYAIYNHLSLIDQAGEYYFNETAEGDGTHKVWLWPPVGNPNTNAVSVSVPAARHSAFKITANRSYLTFTGLKMQKYAGGGAYGGSYGGSGINFQGSTGTSHMTVTGCDFRYIRHDFCGGNGYGALILGGSYNLVDGNTFVDLPVTNAMQCSSSNSIFQNNYIERPGRMGLWMVFTDCQIIGNFMTDVRGTHADGIAVFLGSSNVTLMGNVIVNSSVPLCVQQSSSITVAYNLLHCPNMYAFADYGDNTNLLVHNNTFLRDNDYPSARLDSLGEGQPGFEFKNNIRYTYANQGSLTPDANGNLTLNQSMNSSVFADAPNDDFHLRSGSPAIDAGEDLGYEYDLDGEEVPQGDAPDSGCYEYPQ